MRFGQPPTPAPYLSKKDQRRLLGMVLTLSFVVFAVIWAAQPSTWYWLVPPDNETAQNEDVAPEGYGGDAPLLGSESSSPVASSPFSNSSESNSISLGSAAVPQDWLNDVADSEMGIRVAEQDAYYRVLAHAQRADEDFLAKEARSDVLHVNLIRDADRYRGLPIAIRGTARRIESIGVNENNYGVKTLYEIWMTTPDSGNDPWRIVATSIDERLPQGSDVSVPVKVTGFFFKQYSYASQGGLHVAPLLLAATVEPNIVRKVAPSGTGLEPYILGLAALIGCGAIFSVLVYSYGDWRFKQKMAEQFPVEDAEAKRLLEELPNQKEDPSLFHE